MVRLTYQHIGGLCSGFGLGLVVGTALSWGWHPALVIPGFLLVAVGAWVSRAAQRVDRQRDATSP